MTPTPEEIERLADETLVWGTYMRDPGLIRKHLRGYATALRSLATIQRERDEARRSLQAALNARDASDNAAQAAEGERDAL